MQPAVKMELLSYLLFNEDLCPYSQIFQVGSIILLVSEQEILLCFQKYSMTVCLSVGEIICEFY